MMDRADEVAYQLFDDSGQASVDAIAAALREYAEEVVAGLMSDNMTAKMSDPARIESLRRINRELCEALEEACRELQECVVDTIGTPSAVHFMGLVNRCATALAKAREESN